MSALRLAAIVLLFDFCGWSRVQAQFGEPARGVFSGTGVVEIEKPASRMRMVVEIAGHGPSIAEASRALLAQIAAARESVVLLGADEKSISHSDPRLKQEENSEQARMLARLQQQLGRGGRAAKVEVPKVVTLTARLTAEWELAAGDRTEQLVKCHELQQALREAKLAGAEAEQQLTPEEQELLQEAMFYSSDDEAKPGEPSFLFLAAVTEEERAAAIKSGFEKAKDQAQRVARAIGSGLGELEAVQLSESGSADGADEMMYYDYGSPRSQLMRSLMGQAENREEGQAFGTEPGTLKFIVRVDVSFGKQ